MASSKFGTLPKPTTRLPKPYSRGGGFIPDTQKERPLTGVVQNVKAAKGEERLARALDAGIRKGIVDKYYFRWTTLKRGMVGYKELDFLALSKNGTATAISVKGESFVHRGTAAQEQDKINEIMILQKLSTLGIHVPKVTTVADTQLATQELANKTARDLGLYR